MMTEVAPVRSAAMARERASVVLPAPPFWAINAIVFMSRSILGYKLTLRIVFRRVGQFVIENGLVGVTNRAYPKMVCPIVMLLANGTRCSMSV
jgi:hypothetical protein